MSIHPAELAAAAIEMNMIFNPFRKGWFTIYDHQLPYLPRIRRLLASIATVGPTGTIGNGIVAVYLEW